MAKVVIYSKVPCPYCVSAKRFLDDKGVSYEEIDLTDKYDEMDAIKAKTGWRTFPIIMIDDTLIGGYNDLKAMDDAGKLDPLLK